MNKELEEPIATSKAKVSAMTPEEIEAMLRIQCEGYVKAELSWPKPNFEIKDGVIVYASYEDYCNS